MIQRNNGTFLWLLAGLLLSLLVFVTVFLGLSGHILVADPDGIPEAVDTLMHALQTGDWETVDESLSGDFGFTPELGEADSAERMIYEAYQNSLQWTCADTFLVQGPCVTQNVRVSCLDIPSVTHSMAEILADMDENISASQDAVLYTAAAQVLQTNAPVIQREITLTLQRENNQWRVVPNNALLALLSAFTSH